ADFPWPSQDVHPERFEPLDLRLFSDFKDTLPLGILEMVKTGANNKIETDIHKSMRLKLLPMITKHHWRKTKRYDEEIELAIYENKDIEEDAGRKFKAMCH
ncbi:hypothetical protein Tco_1515599, partial [Tanacetum coccineum]